MIEKIKTAIEALRNKKPVILNLTNYVTMDFVANGLLALGSRPIMSVCSEEIEELIILSSAININIGTLEKNFIERCHLAANQAQHRKSIVLDPVGAGASRIRTQTAIALLPYATIVKGNGSEIIALNQQANQTLGVDSSHTTAEAQASAKSLAQQHRCTIMVSGATDYITDGQREKEVPYGSDLMPCVTGMGCLLTAIIAAFSTIIEDPFEACVIAAHYVALCGALSGQRTTHPESFRSHFIDALHEADFYQLQKIYETQS